MNYTKTLIEMEPGEIIKDLPSDAYTTFCGTRQRLKTKSIYKDWHWSFKCGGGILTIRRTK